VISGRRFLTSVSGRALAALFFVTLLASTGSGDSSGAQHPSLVDPSKTRCTTCHDAVLAKSVRHSAALESGCSNCHQFVKEDGKTTVHLVSGEPQLCVACHDPISAAAEGSLASPHAPVTVACSNCHDPHSSGHAHLLASSVPPLCVTCHDTPALDAGHQRSVANSDCLACHVPHGGVHARMLSASNEHPPFAERSCAACHRQGTIARARPRNNVCFACHDETSFDAAFVHTAVKKGQCAGCHDPHLGAEPRFLRATGVSMCTACHIAIEAKLGGFPHAPAGDDCSTCHDPHGEKFARQIRDSIPTLCTTCHDASDAALTAKHLDAALEQTDCRACHDPHGSSASSLLLTHSVHPPFADGCNACHASQSAVELAGKTRTELCVACHADIQEAAHTATTPHAAMDIAECTECHTPHVSDEPTLLKLSAGMECTGCHTEKEAGDGEFAHGAVPFLGCRGCHEPHGGARPALLRAGGDDLCLGCHEKSRLRVDHADNVTLLGHFTLSGPEAAAALRMPFLQRFGDHIYNHPVIGHRATGTPSREELKTSDKSFTGELRCHTCHDPHKGSSINHFRGEVATDADLCLTCHRK
jgi:predicted CXXCH cytochrome family protein